MVKYSEDLGEASRQEARPQTEATASATLSGSPKIYVFSNVVGGGDGIAYAMAEDGTVLGSHWCSNEHYARHDLGVVPGARPDRHEHYARHYPGGHEMEFVPSVCVKGHDGLSRAFTLNKRQAEAQKASHPAGEPRADAQRRATPDLQETLQKDVV